MSMPGVERGTVGWDVGGVHTKAVRAAGSRLLGRASCPYELQHAPERLPALLKALAEAVGAGPDDRHAVTMTAELSQYFRTKADGVAWVLDGFREAFGESRIFVAATDGVWRAPARARAEWHAVAAANWSLTARLVAQRHPDALLIDVGSTTTDLIPIVGGRVVADGDDDPSRLAAQELVYTGVVRTPLEALVSQVPYGTGLAGVSAEGFALIGDVHVWRGQLHPDDYDTGTPDGRPGTRDFCGDRLARLLCADRSMLTDRDLDAICIYVADVQLQRIVQAIWRIRRRQPAIREALVVGLGAWLGREAAEAAGLQLLAPDPVLADAHVIAPAAAGALLLEQTA